MKINVRIERAGDGSWTASMTEADSIVLGTGSTREAALADLRSGVELLLEELWSEGRTLPETVSEYVTLEVAA